MQIVPIRDLKDTVYIEKLCAEANEPIFVTKNGYGRLVVMDIDYYSRTMEKLNETRQINKGIDEYNEGKINDGKLTIKNLRMKHGI